ncbi:Hypothetical protein PHPALM_12020 [Phytophthora palmivora]|uniref:Uncharacterized protein n=1 Tax=Phytophthora palmivora TaxID=4796 RepID=A0A2P4Y0S9_9STRA|nr:Hypothetical protein PHPALM_12020 [Phytophthora palmivora]
MEKQGNTELSELLPYLDVIYDNLSSDEGETDYTVLIDADRHRSATSADRHKTKKFRREVFGLLPYSTELQRRKRAELRALQLEEQQLTAKLAQFAKSPGYITVGTGTKSSVDNDERRKWQGRAMVACEDRLRAERMNREFKSILLQQFKSFQSIRKVLGQNDILEGMEFVEQLQPTADRPFFQLDFSDPILSQLSSNLGQLCLQAELVLPDTNDAVTVAFRTQNKYYDRYCYEITSTTPLACSVQEAGDILWRFISNKDDEAADKTFSFVRMSALSTFRKYEDGSRDVIVGSMSWFLPTEGLEYEGNYWAILSSSPTDPAHSSTVRFCYRLYLKKKGAQPTARTQAIMNCIGKQIRCYLQLQQDAFLAKVDPVQIP